MQLIIAEKPSLARNIVKALELDGEVFRKNDGYHSSQNYAVTWCFGHLFSLMDMDDYIDWHGNRPKYTWTLENLPFFPEQFKFVIKPEIDKKTGKPTGKPDPGVLKQFNTIRSLIDQCDTVVNAGDADREGQVIVDNVLMIAKCRKPAYRLWANDQTPETINDCLHNMKKDSEYRNILYEGLARTYMDWLYGINLTRYSTLRTHTLLRVGRVIVPVVQEIVERDRSIENFVPENYLKCVSNREYGGIPLELTSSSSYKMNEKKEAENQCSTYNASGGTVTQLKKENKVIYAPKLFSLSTLQAFLDRDLSPSQVLSAAQSLYEQGLLSYPRTDAEYLFSGEKNKIANIIRRYNDCVFKDTPRIFNDKKNADQSHGAIIPTGKTAGMLSGAQKLVYEAVENRFRAVFWKIPMTADRTTMNIRVCDEDFKISGDIITSPGWSEAEAYKKSDRVLPDLKEGQHIDVAFAPVTKTTTPPKHYTVSELLSFMKNPYKKEEKTDVQLGTEATRAGIIDNAVKSQYIQLKGRSYYALEKGKFFVDAINKLKLGIDKRQSLVFAEDLIAIREGKETVKDVMDKTKETIKETLSTSQSQSADTFENNSNKETLGTCPICGKGKVISIVSKKGEPFYVCDQKECNFIMAQNFKRFDDRINITTAKMKKLLNGETIPAKLTSRTGKKYDANVKLTINQGKFVNLTPVFEEAEELGKCPLCGKPVRNHGKLYCCDGSREGCQLKIWKKMKYYNNEIQMTDSKVKKLIAGESITAKVKTKNDFEYEVNLKLVQNGQWTNLVRDDSK